MRAPWNRRRTQLVSDDVCALSDQADRAQERLTRLRRETKALSNKAQYVKNSNNFAEALIEAMGGLVR